MASKGDFNLSTITKPVLPALVEMARDLWKVPQVQETVTETARLIWTTPGLTINLLPSALALLGLAALALIFSGYFPEIFDIGLLGGCDCGYGSEYSYYVAQAKSHANEYGVPGSGYGGSTNYEDTGLRRRRRVDVPPEARMIYNMTGDLQHSADLDHLHHLLHLVEAGQGRNHLVEAGQGRHHLGEGLRQAKAMLD